MAKKKPQKNRSPIAASLSERQFSHRIVKDKTKYDRKKIKKIKYI